MILAGCKKDLVEPVLHSPSGLTGFTVNSNTVVLSKANDSSMVALFKWPALNYGVTVPVTYTLIIDQPSDTSGANAWGNALKTTIAVDSLNKSWLGTDFNHLLNQLGLTPGVASPVVVRLLANVNQSNGSTSTVPSLSSDIAMTVTCYKVIIVYPKLYVAGDFLTPQWTQIDQPGWIVASVHSDNNYEGYVNFPNANNNFKLCTQVSWNGTNYGWGGSATTISGSGSAGNCWFGGGPAYCKVAVDTKGLTIAYTKTAWTIAGDFNGWSTSANPMTFNANTNVWTATGITLTAGAKLGFKFVGDAGWATNFGLDTKGNLAYNGANIPVTKSGAFTITLDLSQGAGNYTWSLK